jgi:hypothetical protein
MDNQIVESGNFNWSRLRIVGLVVCLCLYISIYVGYLLSNLIYESWNVNANQNYKMIQIHKKFSLKNIFKFLITYISNFLKNWGMRVVEKFPKALQAIDQILDALQILIKKLKLLDTLQILINLIKELKLTRFKFGFKFKFKSKYLNRRLKYYYKLLKEFFITFDKALGTLTSFIKEVAFGATIIEFIIQSYNILLLLMSGSIALISLFYLLYFSLLGLILGFLLGVYTRNKGVYTRNKKIDVLMLLFLLQIFYIRDKSDFSDKLPCILLKPNEVNEFVTFSLETEEHSQINLLKILLILIIWLRESSLKPEIPFPILGDPSVLIDIDIIFNEFPNYEELLKFYPKKAV